MAEKTRECPSCALEGPADVAECPFCGYEFPEPHPRWQVWTAILVALLLAWPLFRLLETLL